MSEASETVDDEVLRLRRQGQTYARISRALGLDRAADAQQAFRRAVRRLPVADAEQVRERSCRVWTVWPSKFGLIPARTTWTGRGS